MKQTQTFLSRIKREFPQLSWNQAKHLQRGWDHDVIILDNRLVFRFPNDAEYRRKLAHEVPLMRYLKSRITIPIPAYTHVAKDKSFAGYPFIPGDMLFRGTYRRMNKSSRVTVARQLAEFLSELHAVPLSVARRYDTPESGPHDRLRGWRRTIRGVYPALTKAECALAEAFFAEALESVDYRKLPRAHARGFSLIQASLAPHPPCPAARCSAVLLLC